jgi:hypothetical protein
VVLTQVTGARPYAAFHPSRRRDPRLALRGKQTPRVAGETPEWDEPRSSAVSAHEAEGAARDELWRLVDDNYSGYDVFVVLTPR